MRDVEVDRPRVGDRRRRGGSGRPTTWSCRWPSRSSRRRRGGGGRDDRLASRRPPRRSDPAGDPARLALAGHPIVGARSQTGVIGVARPIDATITPVEGRGVRRVDPLGPTSPRAFRGRPRVARLRVRRAAVRPRPPGRGGRAPLRGERPVDRGPQGGAGRGDDHPGRPGLGRAVVRHPRARPPRADLRADRRRLARRPDDPVRAEATAARATRRSRLGRDPHRHLRPPGGGRGYLRGPAPGLGAGSTATGPASVGVVLTPSARPCARPRSPWSRGANRRFDLTEGDGPRFVRLDPGRRAGRLDLAQGAGTRPRIGRDLAPRRPGRGGGPGPDRGLSAGGPSPVDLDRGIGPRAGPTWWPS